MVLVCAATVARDATGNLADMANDSFAFLNCTPGELILLSIFFNKINTLQKKDQWKCKAAFCNLNKLYEVFILIIYKATATGKKLVKWV